MPRKKTVKKTRLALKPLSPNSLLMRISRINVVYILGFLLIIASFLIGVLLTKVSYLESSKTTAIGTSQTADISQAPAKPVKVSGGHLPVLGDKNAKVTIIEFADFQCPYCEQYFKNIEPNLKKDYVDSGKAKFAFRHYAFLGQESIYAANASECANEQGKFWDFHDYLYNHQGQENSGTFSVDNLKQFAATLGLDTVKFNDCLDNNKYQKNIDKDLSEGGMAGVSGTPATFVNGNLIAGAVPYEELKAEIEKNL